jgi:hypothetical protein
MGRMNSLRRCGAEYCPGRRSLDRMAKAFGEALLEDSWRRSTHDQYTSRTSARLACDIRKGQTCDAFPKEIPDAIFTYGDDHRKPVEGDGGKTYRPDPKKQEFMKDWLSFNNN